MNYHELSLAEERDYYQQQADDPHNRAADRALWQMLADAITRIMNEGDDTPHPTLFD